MPLGDADKRRLLAAALALLEPLGARSIHPGAPVSGGSGRSHLLRAIADRGNDSALNMIIKAPVDPDASLGREAAGLLTVRDHGLPGAVRLLAISEDPPALILEDLGDGPSVADRLLGDSGSEAEQAVLDWARTLGQLHAASVGLEDIFAEHLSRFGTDPESVNLSRSLLARTADRLTEALAPYGVAPCRAALAELRELTGRREPLPSQAVKGLVPGDNCPDNAIYVDGQLTLIDFESAAYRPAAWDAAYLTVPWPTCWCCWALPAELSRRALKTWRETAGPSGEIDDSDLAAAEILWATITLGFRLPRITDGTDPTAAHAAEDPPRPAGRAVLLHRLAVAASAETAALPHLRELAATAHAKLEASWGQQTLPLAPAFRAPGPMRPTQA